MDNVSEKKLLFVYNANSGLVNNWLDIAHKIVKPETYACDLCALTHGSFREKQIWKDFRQEFAMPMEFYHKDEFLKKYKSKWLPSCEFPIILVADGHAMEPYITAKDFEEINSVEVLMRQLKSFKH